MKSGYPIRVYVTLSLLLPAVAFPAVFNVSTFAELTNALATASSNGENDTVNLAANTYTLTTMLTYDATETNSLTLQCLTNKAVLDADLNSQCLKIYARAASTNAFVTLDGLVIKNGYYGQDGFGSFIGAGALIWSQRGNITVRNSEFSDCFASGGLYYSGNAGGAYLNLQSIGTISVSNCVFTNNNAKNKGGGAYLTGGSGVTIVLRNNLFVNNKAQEYGAGAYLYSVDTPVFAENNTFVSNQTQVALYVKLYNNTATAWIQNNIFWTNAVSVSYSNDLYVEDDGDGSGSGATNFVFNNDIWSAGWQVGDHLTQSVNVARDPMLAATRRLLNGSPCINTGTNLAWMTNAVDLDGNPRINSLIVDRGCYEYQLAEGAILGTNLAVIASGEAPSLAKGTDFGLLRSGVAATNFLRVTNSSPTVTLTISGVSTSGAGAALFQLSSLPASVAPGGVSNFTLRYAPVAGGLHTAVVTILSNLTNSPYYLNLKGSAWQLSQAAGPSAGGNLLTITNGLLGNGTNITNVVIGGTSAAILGQGATWVRVTAPTGAPGLVDVVVQSASEGSKTLSGAYTFNPPGQIVTNLPATGAVTGGYPVVISGTNLSDGTAPDVTNVTLAGAAAGVQSVAGSTQIVVLAGPGAPGVGHVVVNSIAYGHSIASNAFTYIGPRLQVLGANGAVVVSSEPATLEKGTDFGGILVGQAKTNTMAITNSGNGTLTITGIITNGVNSFQCLGMPATVSAGGVSNFTLIFGPVDGGVATAVVAIANDSTSSPYQVNMCGTGVWDGVIGIAPAAVTFTAVYGGVNPAGQLLVLTNRGGTRFLFTNQLGYSAGASGWLTATPATGTLPVGGTSNLTASVDIAGVNAGVHWATNAVVSLQATNSPQIVTVQLTVSQAVQIITFAAIPDSVATARVALAATASSGLPVAFTVTSGPGVVSGSSTLTFSGTGTVTVVATQTGNGNWQPAPAVTQSCAVIKANQTINFSAIPEQTTTSRVTLAATAASGLPVNFSVASGLGIISGDNVLTFSGTGVVSVVASQDGNALWNAAVNVTNNVNVRDVSTLAAPQNLSASDGTYTDKVALAWNAVSGGSGYQVWRAGENNVAAATHLGNASLTAYDDDSSAARAATRYYYWVKAWNSVTTSEFSNVDGGFCRLSANPEILSGQPVVGDYDADGKADPAVYDLASGHLCVWLSSAGYTLLAPEATFQVSIGDLPLTADFDADGASDPGVFEPATGSWYVWLSSAGYNRAGPGMFSLSADDIPIPADYDADTKADPAVYQASSGSWYVWPSSYGYAQAGPLTQFHVGAVDIPVPGRYDTDGRADPAVYQAVEGAWYVWMSSSGYGQFGPAVLSTTTNHIAVAADYDGDGLCDPAAYLPTLSQWRMWMSGNNYTLAEMELR